MRHRFALIAAVAILCCAGTVQAQLIYSFESPAVTPDGFGPNGGGVTIAQDTIGATDGTHSMKASVVTGATFVGALTTNLPGPLNNPPGVDAIKFDMTIGPNDVFTGGFDIVGITVFGLNAPLGQFGLQAQFGPFIHVDGKAAGTYTDLTIPLTGATNPLTFATGQTFNDIFTTGTPDANHLNPSGFQFFINKSNDAPTTIYIDNVRVVPSVPEPATCGLVVVGAVVLGAIGRRRSG
jgi:hypothetical protein